MKGSIVHVGKSRGEPGKGSAPSPSKDKVQAYRDRMRAQGMRPLQIWVPDTRSESFKEEARRQCLAVASSPQEKNDLAFIDSLFDDDWNDAE
jgi:Protein  of unknown function (DUF3018)